MHGNPSAPANPPVAQANVGIEADDRLAYSVNEAAQRLGVGPMTLYREIAEGKLPAIRIRDRVLVPKVVLERLVEPLQGVRRPVLQRAQVDDGAQPA
jgi:excisionase family DNA binding protein